MKSDVEETQKSAPDFNSRVAPLDAKLAGLDARIQRNKADLERTNAELTLKIAEMLKRLGCEIGQGYLFSKPSDAATIERILAAKYVTQPSRPGRT